MKILVIGGGGREHALVWKLARSPMVKELFCAPGNPGIARLAKCIDVPAHDVDGLATFARNQSIDLTVVGPEDPLANGLVDRFAAEGLKAFGPTAAAARLEASKAFAKDFMRRHHIPSSNYAEFDDPDDAIAYVKREGAPIVIKADGLAAGKGVTVAHDLQTAIQAIQEAMIDRAFGDAGARVVIEECLIGEEASILAFADGKTVVPMIPSQDHKPVYDNDEGPNTGGMGAYAPTPLITPECLDEITRTILRPCVEGMARDGCPYTGVLYAGLMMTQAGPKVIEFNCRFGDPETQVVLPLLESDLVPILLACCDGTLDATPAVWSGGACVTVVMASGGYPKHYAKGKTITGIAQAEHETGVVVFHAGTKQEGEQIVTNGGRVLNVTAQGSDIASTIKQAYQGVQRIAFEGVHYRNDIGAKALRRLST